MVRALEAYGRAGHAEIVTRNARCAELLGAGPDAHPAFRLLASVRLNVVCFTLAEDPSRAPEFLAALAATGETFLTPTVLDGVPAVRAAFSNWRTTPEDTARTPAAITSAANTWTVR